MTDDDEERFRYEYKGFRCDMVHPVADSYQKRNQMHRSEALKLSGIKSGANAPGVFSEGQSDRCRHVFRGSSGDEYRCQLKQGHNTVRINGIARYSTQHQGAGMTWFTGSLQEFVMEAVQPVPLREPVGTVTRGKGRSRAADLVFGS